MIFFMDYGLRRKSVNIILPALREEETIADVIEEIYIGVDERRFNDYMVSVAVILDNENDPTKDVVEKIPKRDDVPIEIIVQGMTGYGNAFKRGLEHGSNYDFCFKLDADRTYSPKDISNALMLLEEYDFDLVLGSRIKGHMYIGSMSRINYIGNLILTLLTNILYGANISDAYTGFRGFRRETIDIIKDKLESEGFSIDAEMIIACIKNNLKIGEMPIDYRPRKTKSKLSRLAAIDIMKALLKGKLL